MPTNPAFTLIGYLSWIADHYCKTMATEACRRRMGVLSVAICVRLRGFERRFCFLHAMWKAGTLPQARSAGAGAHPLHTGGKGEAGTAFDPMACDAATLDRARLRPASVLPRAFAWLHKLLPVSAPPLAGEVRSLLWNYPEMVEFVAACPQAGRILRPLCRMVGLKPPEWMALPKRVRVRKEDTSPRPSPHSGEGEVQQRRRRRTPREIAEAAVRRSDATGKPVDIRKIPSVVWGYIVHPPRDDNCPPPEIGYGGRRWRPPKDYKPSKD